MDKSQKFGLIGSALLFIGAFMPIVSLPIVGTINYFQNGQGDGVFILILAVVSVILSFTKMYRGLWLSGGAALALMIFSFVNLILKISEMKEQMESRLANNPFRGIAELAVQSIQIQWGWAVMLVGALMVIAASFMVSSAPTEQVEEAPEAEPGDA